MAFNEKKHLIEDLTADKQAMGAEIADLNARLEAARPIGRIASAVEVALVKYRETGVLEEDAQAQAEVEVTAAEKERLKGDLAESLKRDHYEEYAAQVRTEQGPTIRQQLIDLFQSDGTFARLREIAENDEKAKIQEEVKAEYLAEIGPELNSPAAKKKYKQEVKEQLADSVDVQEYRERTRNQLEEAWRTEVEAETYYEIDAQEKTREQEFKDSYKTQYLQSRDGQEYRSRVRANLEEEWKDRSREEIAQAVNDEELHALLDKQASRAKEKMAKDMQTLELLEAFEGYGIDVSNLPEGKRLVVQLGTNKLTKQNEIYQNSYGEDRYREVDALTTFCDRKLTLLSRGKGKFVVDGDSLHESASVYERDVAIRRGSIISIGRKVEEHGEERLEHYLAADVPFYYDTDENDPAIIDTHLPIANIVIDGVFARSIKYIQMV